MMTIVLAWLDDAGQRQAALWLASGTTEDYADAQRHARERGLRQRVYTYPLTERDPLGRARKDLACDQHHSAGLRRYHPLAN